VNSREEILQDTVELALPRDRVFAFFSDPANLECLTPPWLGFRMLTPAPLPRGAGAIYDYALALHGLPLRWRTLITEWDEGRRFQDIQLRGPYALWQHTHTFEDSPGGGTRMRDEVRWRLPLGALGRLAAPFVRRDVAKIFDYRKRMLQQLVADGQLWKRSSGTIG